MNLILVGLTAGALAILDFPALAGLFTLLGVLTIGLRGYLIPGTPELTRKFPNSVRACVGKVDPAVSFPATEALVSSGALNNDLTLDTATAKRVSERAENLVANPKKLEVAALDAVPDAVETSIGRSLGGGENWFVHDAGEATVQQWEARPIAAIDVASAEYLSDALPKWWSHSDWERRTMLALFRYGTADCPSCGEPFVEFNGPDVTCCGGRSLVGERRCASCGYALVDQNDLPVEAREGKA